MSLKPFQNFAASRYVCSANSVYIHILQSYWTTLFYWAYQSSVICSPYVAIDQIFRRMNLSALVLHLTWAVPDIFASCVSNGIHSVSIKYTSLFNREYFLHPPVSRASEYGISLFEICERPLHRVRVDNRPRRYVLKIHFFIEFGLKMIQFKIQFKTKSKIFIQKNIHSIESRIFNRIIHS